MCALLGPLKCKTRGLGAVGENHQRCGRNLAISLLQAAGRAHLACWGWKKVVMGIGEKGIPGVVAWNGILSQLRLSTTSSAAERSIDEQHIVHMVGAHSMFRMSRSRFRTSVVGIVVLVRCAVVGSVCNPRQTRIRGRTHGPTKGVHLPRCTAPRLHRDHKGPSCSTR